MNDFFITLEVPELNSHYAQNLQQLVLNINSNFAKIASLPFLKGDSGVSIETHDEPLYIVEEGGTKVYTDFGKAVINAIYGVDSFPTEEFTINGIHSYDDLMNVQYIPVFYDRVQGLKYLTVPFMFHDKRKNELGMVVDNMAESFEDMSTFVIGKMIRNSETGETEWVLESHNFEPKLYYNTETQKFCWAIGSQKTDIIAQGVEGRAGQSVYAKYCQGMFIGDDRTYIYLNTVLNENDLQDTVDGGGTINDCFVPIDDTNLSVGDFVMVLYNKEVDGGTIEDLSFGKVMEVGGSLCIPYLEGTTIYNSTQNVTLKALLDTIGKTAEGTTTTPNVRGLYVYGETEQSAQNNGRMPRTPHMLWIDDNGVAHLSKLKTDITDSEGNYVNQTTQNNPVVNGNGELQVDYNMLKVKNIDANLYKHDGDVNNQPKIQSFGSDTEDKFELKHTVAKYASSNTNLYYVPNMIVSYTEPTSNMKGIGSIDIGGSVDIGKIDVGNSSEQTVEDKLEVIIPLSSNYPSALTKIQITKGGTFEFELPHLGLIDNNDQSSLLNSKQFVRNIDGNPTPIKVVLEKTDMNNNDPDSTNKHLKNNTSYGWRHYLDMSLMASPTNSTIYAGTNSSVLKLDYEGKVYKANIKYTVVQYEVGYNNYGELDFYKGTWRKPITKYPNIGYTTDAVNGEPRYSINLSKPDVVETHRSQWYEKATATDTNIPKFHKYTAKHNDYYDGDVNKGKITLFVPSNIVIESTSVLQNNFEREEVDNEAVEYKRKSLNNGRQFKYRTTVTDVIHYILPVPSQYLTETDIDIYNKLNLGESDYACMRYRLFFKGKSNDLVENVENIYINPINEPLTYETDGLVAQITKTNNVDTNNKYAQNMVDQDGQNDFSKGYIFYPLLNNDQTQYKNLFIIRKNTARSGISGGITDGFNSIPTFFTDNYTLDTSIELFTNNFGKYNDFCWVFGSLTTDTPQPKTGLGSGHLLPELAQPQNYKWMIRLGDEKFQIPDAYSYIYSTAKRSNSKEVNKLSTNLNQADYKGIGIYKNENSTQPSKQIRYISAMDDGWYINKRKIVTESVLTEARKIYNYDDSLLIPNTGNQGGGSNSGGSGDSEFNPESNL